MLLQFLGVLAYVAAVGLFVAGLVKKDIVLLVGSAIVAVVGYVLLNDLVIP